MGDPTKGQARKTSALSRQCGSGEPSRIRRTANRLHCADGWRVRGWLCRSNVLLPTPHALSRRHGTLDHCQKLPGLQRTI